MGTAALCGVLITHCLLQTHKKNAKHVAIHTHSSKQIQTHCHPKISPLSLLCFESQNQVEHCNGLVSLVGWSKTVGSLVSLVGWSKTVGSLVSLAGWSKTVGSLVSLVGWSKTVGSLVSLVGQRLLVV